MNSFTDGTCIEFIAGSLLVTRTSLLWLVLLVAVMVFLLFRCFLEEVCTQLLLVVLHATDCTTRTKRPRCYTGTGHGGGLL